MRIIRESQVWMRSKAVAGPAGASQARGLRLKLAAPGVRGMEIYKSDFMSLKAGFWGQAWYQTVSDGRDTDGNGRQESGIYDTLIRRAYFYAGGSLGERVSFFVHVSSDRLGQDYIHNRPAFGLGANMALRDGWVTFDLWKRMIRLQIGRMYIPLTRNYGTTSTRSLLNLDLDWTQGGIRSGAFYPSKVGRDDGICLWGNVLNNRLQYRFMVGEGIWDDSLNP